ncbi:hypothetical protein GXP67_13390 [Rhodocytophaga rosea]|uniref:RNA polymerase sigma factor 70 region 4 type 2 domain-containing protein n=1 Tax=Rhodocytophaga rosea TaxID=2704465 RepID=A0A6C0GHX0_9BACT|nr:sigma factor-like helix-turn-helix DNA-binding protein [Rhodocytophaga rosea]QHT67549.1 hypothetical protein GXP67_13390 [Rhodocytophaga rosea]
MNESDHSLIDLLQKGDYQAFSELLTLPDEYSGFSLETVMQLLPPRRGRIIPLIIEQGKSHKEVAREMDISVSTVKNQMLQAKKYLQHTINPAAMDR